MASANISMGRRIQPLFQDLGRIWGLGLRLCLKDEVIAQVGHIAPEWISSQPGLNRIGADLYSSKGQSAGGDALELICDFSQSSLRPKRDHLEVVAFLRKVAEALISRDGQAPALFETLERFRLVASPRAAADFLLTLLVQQFQAERGFLRFKKAHREAVSAHSCPLGAGEGDERFHALVERREMDQILKGQVPQLLELDEPEFAGSQFLLCGLNEHDVFACVVLAVRGERWTSGDPANLKSLLRQAVSLYNSLLLTHGRESQFLESERKARHMEETAMELQLDLAELEARFTRLQTMNDRLTQTLQIWNMMQIYPKGRPYLEKMLVTLRHFLHANTAALCFPDLFGMHLLIKHDEEPTELLSFSELDGGLYYEMGFQREATLWDGDSARHFFLPSGHPRIRNCLCLPLYHEDRLALVVLLGNRVGAPFVAEDAAALAHLLHLLQEDLHLSFNQLSATPG